MDREVASETTRMAPDAGAEPPEAEAAAADGEPASLEPAEAEAADPGDAPGPVAEAESAAGADGRPSGPVTVTVVPGVARYHRSGCILIRFLGDDDLQTMSRQAAEDASFVPCRACQPDQLTVG